MWTKPSFPRVGRKAEKIVCHEPEGSFSVIRNSALYFVATEPAVRAVEVARLRAEAKFMGLGVLLWAD